MIYQYLEHDTWKCVDITLKNVIAHDRNDENPKIYLEAVLRSGNVSARGARRWELWVMWARFSSAPYLDSIQPPPASSPTISSQLNEDFLTTQHVFSPKVF